MAINKNNFYGFSLLKQFVKGEMLKNQDIVNLICNKSNNMVEFADVSKGKKSPAREYIRQYKFVPETIEEESVFVTMEGVVNETNKFSIKDIDLIIYVFAHSNLMEMEQGIRTDILAGYIDNAINGTDEVGIGRLELVDAEEFNPIKDYYGWALRYTIYDVNRVGKKI